MNKTISIIVTVALLLGLVFIFKDRTGLSGSNGSSTEQSGQNIEIKEGVQWVTIKARGGYSPRLSEAQAGWPTKLVMETNGTYDCSAALVIREVGYQSVLPQTGQTEIDLGTPKAGEIIQGVCSMGMYSFKIRFD